MERRPTVRDESFWSSCSGVDVDCEVRFRFFECESVGWFSACSCTSACASASASASAAAAPSALDAEVLLVGSLASSSSLSRSDSVASASETSTVMMSSVSLVSSVRGAGSTAGAALCSSGRRSLAMGLLHMRHVTSTSVSWGDWSGCCVVTVSRTMPCSDSLHVAVTVGLVIFFLGRPRGLGAEAASRTACSSRQDACSHSRQESH
jgi:hypothetical protein